MSDFENFEIYRIYCETVTDFIMMFIMIIGCVSIIICFSVFVDKCILEFKKHRENGY